EVDAFNAAWRRSRLFSHECLLTVSARKFNSPVAIWEWKRRIFNGFRQYVGSFIRDRSVCAGRAAARGGRSQNFGYSGTALDLSPQIIELKGRV
ncbi:hypothetical protein, partial [Roseibium sp.]|uniref:hypothetical protein n=1 Tax=Roseibium sp. TaxID=1936156 RepID=UPI003D0DF4DB